MAAEVLFQHLGKFAVLDKVNSSKAVFHQGISSFGRIREVICIIFQVWRLCRTADVVYFNVSQSLAGNLKDLLIFTACWRKLDRMVIHLHGGAGMREILSSKHPLLRAVNAFFLRRLGAVIVLGDRLKGIYEGIVPPSRVYAVPNFAKDEFFVDESDLQAKFSTVEPLRLLFLSNLLPGKGHEELLAALSLLPEDAHSRLHLDFAGGFESPEAEARFRQQVQAVQDVKIQVHGVVHGEHKRELLRKAHLFCLPTYYPYEGQPISILEAFASGCAVMTTDHSGIFDTFAPGVNGLEVKPRAPESIAQAIQHALAHTNEIYKYASNNLQSAQLKYRTSSHVEALEKIIFSVTR